MIMTQKTFYEMIENTCKTNSTEVLRHATMQRTKRKTRKQGENMRGMSENIVSFI